MQEGNKSLGMLKNMKFLLYVSYIIVDLKKLVCDVFHAGSAGVESECIKRKSEAIRISLKHKTSLETSPYAIQKHHAIHISNFTLYILR